MILFRLSAALCASAAAFLIPSASLAELGGSYSGVQRDQAHLHAQLQSQTRAGLTTHVMTLAVGSTVKEFTNASGTVYAVSWRGHGKPDLRQLLGAHFNTMQAHYAQTRGRVLRHAALVNEPSLVVQSGGHPGAFWGVAYLPQAVPAGVSVTDLQ